jgi:hypothetical protein
MYVQRFQTGQGTRIVFPKNWPTIRDYFDQYLPTGARNPDFTPRAEEPKFHFSHELVRCGEALSEAFFKDPRDQRYKNRGRLFVIDGRRYLQSEEAKKAREPKVFISGGVVVRSYCSDQADKDLEDQDD